MAVRIPDGSGAQSDIVADTEAAESEASKNAFQGAQTAHLNEQTKQLAQPGEPEAAKTITTDQGIMGWNPKTLKYDIQEGGAPEKGDKFALHETDQGLMRVNNATGEVEPVLLHGQPLKGQLASDKPLDQDTANSLNRIYNATAKKYGLPENQFRTGMPGAEANQVRQSLGDVIGKQQGAQRIIVSTDKGNQAADTRRDAQTTKEYTRAVGGIHKAFDALNKQSDSLDEARQLINGSAPAQAIGQIKTLSGLASGAGSGVRITQTELNSLAHARGFGDSFDGWLNSMSGKGNLSKKQVSQIDQMLGDISGRVHEKQQRYADTVDRLNAARSPQEVRQIESELMHSQAAGTSQPASGGSSPAPARHMIEVNGKRYQYKGSGATDDMNSYTEVKK